MLPTGLQAFYRCNNFTFGGKGEQLAGRAHCAKMRQLRQGLCRHETNKQQTIAGSKPLDDPNTLYAGEL